MAFLFNQMNVNAFKINTLEKLDSSLKTQKTSEKSDFSKELKSAVSEKRKSDITETSSLKKFEKKLSKVNHEAKANANARNNEKISDKKAEELQSSKKKENQIGDGTDAVNKAADKNAADTSAETKKAEAGTPEEKTVKADAKTDEAQNAAEETVNTISEELKTDVQALSENLTKAAEQMVNLLQDLTKNAGNENAMITEGLTKATELLGKINTGSIEPKDAYDQLVKLADQLQKTVEGSGEGVKSDSTFQNLLDLTGQKLKVMKNDLADVKAQMTQINGKSELLSKLMAQQNQGDRVEANQTEQIAKTLESVGKADAETAAKPTQEKTVETTAEKTTEAPEKIALAQPKKSVDQLDEKMSAKDVKGDEGGTVSKVEKANAESKANSGNTENESFSKNAGVTAGTNTVKTEKPTENVSFQNVVQSVAKETEKTTETARMARTIAPEKAEVLSQIVKKADLFVGKTQSEMVMKLDPENLGKVTLKITMERGTMTAAFQAENPQVKSLIEQNADSLKEMLQEKGINVSAINVSVNQQSGEGLNGQNQQQNLFNANASNRNGIGNRGNGMIGAYGIVGMTDAIQSKNNPYTKHDGELDLKG